MVYLMKIHRSMLVLQGRSTDFAKHAIPSIRKQRILVTLTKSQPKRMATGDVPRFAPSVGGAPSHWVPPPSRSPNHIRHPAGPKHYGPVPTTGVLPAPNVRAQLPPPPPNGIQPIFVAAPVPAVAPAIPFPTQVALPPASAGWPAGPPRHPPPRLPAPGTGVFLPPPGSGSGSSNQPLAAAAATQETEGSSSSETTSPPLEKDTVGNTNGDNASSPKSKKIDESLNHQECNGNVDGNGNENGHAEVSPTEEEEKH